MTLHIKKDNFIYYSSLFAFLLLLILFLTKGGWTLLIFLSISGWIFYKIDLAAYKKEERENKKLFKRIEKQLFKKK